jgi:hypothetical protein
MHSRSTTMPRALRDYADWRLNASEMFVCSWLFVAPHGATIEASFCSQSSIADRISLSKLYFM